MERHCANGEKMAHFLRNHPAVEKVYWPGFTDHPNHEIAKTQMRGFRWHDFDCTEEQSR
jgi:cystathionine gamma-lyase